MDISARIRDIQQALQQAGIDGWILADFHNRDTISCRVLGLDEGKFTSRRWFYVIPAAGEPTRIVHSVEPGKLDSLPGNKVVYLPWQQLHQALADAVRGMKQVAMQYSPQNAIPYIDLADPGIVELVSSFGPQVVSSANLVQRFEACLDAQQLQTHIDASVPVQAIKDQAFALVADAVANGRTLTEYEVQRFIISRFEEEGLTCDQEWPIVAVNEHAADPHFEPTLQRCSPIRKGDMLLIDLWARFNKPGAIYYDITWCGFVGTTPPDKYRRIWAVATAARDAALQLVKNRFSAGTPVFGYEVDQAARRVVEEAGFGPYFVHRTGHSIGTRVHGNGVHMDSLETKDERTLVPGICFSIEPGIYIAGEMGVRTEINVAIDTSGTVFSAGPIQKELLLIG